MNTYAVLCGNVFRCVNATSHKDALLVAVKKHCLDPSTFDEPKLEEFYRVVMLDDFDCNELIATTKQNPAFRIRWNEELQDFEEVDVIPLPTYYSDVPF